MVRVAFRPMPDLALFFSIPTDRRASPPAAVPSTASAISVIVARFPRPSLRTVPVLLFDRRGGSAPFHGGSWAIAPSPTRDCQVRRLRLRPRERPTAPDPLGALFVDLPTRPNPPPGLDGAARATAGVESGRDERLSAVHPAVQRARIAQGGPCVQWCCHLPTNPAAIARDSKDGLREEMARRRERIDSAVRSAAAIQRSTPDSTVSARYCRNPRDVSGANPQIKKCSRGL
jgi:hypothetical protein